MAMTETTLNSATPKNPPVYGGGTLVQLDAKWDDTQAKAQTWPKLTVSTLEMFDLYLMGIGAYSPLAGFMDEPTYRSVVDTMTLPDGLPWSVPITLSTTEERAESLEVGQTLLLENEQQIPVGYIELKSIYRPDKTHEAKQVYRTDEMAHPGVAALFKRGTVYLSGPVRVFEEHITYESKDKHFAPAVSRKLFLEKGWRTVVGFQTRNPIHRAHEYIQKCALESVDGLFVHPLVGETKSDDIPANVRMKCYEALLDNYYNPANVFLGVYPAAMRYAGPREAILHAIVRQNYGCTHFIVGRDHAGVGNYYGTYDAQNIFHTIDRSRMAIVPMFYEHTFYDQTSKTMASVKTVHPDKANPLTLSGTKVRELLVKGEDLPEEFTRKEVADVLKEAYRNMG